MANDFFTLDVEALLNDLQLGVKRAELLSDDLMEDYFDRIDFARNNPDTLGLDYKAIAAVYSEMAGIKAGLVYEILRNMVKQVEALCAIMRKVSEGVEIEVKREAAEATA